MTTSFEQLQQNLRQLQADHEQAILELRVRVKTVETRSRHERNRLRVQAGLAFVAFIGAVFVLPGNRAAVAQGYGVTLQSLAARMTTAESSVTALQSKTQYMSVNTTAKSTTFSGCNVIVNDGGGTTDTIVKNTAGRGVGNLIIGYNPLGSGSHNLILGEANNYSSFGAIVAGVYSTSSAANACVLGGYGNTASGEDSVVSGGYNNTASGQLSGVGGGYNILVSANYGWAAGGTGTGNYHSP